MTATPEELVTRAMNVAHPTWREALAGCAPLVRDLLLRAIKEAQSGEQILPAPEHVLRALATPLPDVRVLIVGQDPYPTPGHPVGLSFAVARDVRPLPRSLVNIYTELEQDLGITPAEHGDLTHWADQGVMLLNRCLTVRAGKPASHSGWGWEDVTDACIRALAKRGGPLVAVLWGAKAGSLAPLLADTPCLRSAHPSPLSARRGFFGSAPFSAANRILTEQGSDPIDWRVA